jgi:hypothetical protein
VPDDFGAYVRLSDEQKERLCRQLLAEFGVTKVNRSTDRGELIHSCCLPYGNHARGDRSASASLNFRKLTYSCFVCGGGGLLWFIGTCRGTTSTEARKWLRDQTGQGAVQELAALLEFFDALYEPGTLDEPIPKISDRVLEPWLFLHPYVTEVRHVPAETAMHFKVGWDRNEERIIIPHYWQGDLVGWQARNLRGGVKYVSSPDFPRHQTLFNYDYMAQSVVVVESAMSVLSKYHAGYHMEATFGAMITKRQQKLLSKHPRVVLFFDNDSAGWNATEQVGDALTPYSVVTVAANQYAADPADMGDDMYRQCVENAIPYALWRRPFSVKVLPEEAKV